MLEKMVEDEAGKVFWAYSRSCVDGLKAVGGIDDIDYTSIKEYEDRGEVPEREFLERVYPSAIGRIKKVAGEIGREYWDEKTIRDYFVKRHNEIIDRQEGRYAQMSPEMRELCKVKVGKIVEMKKESDVPIYNLDYGDGNKEWVIGKNLPDAKIGDYISTHWRFACEVITDENYRSGK